MSRYRDFDFLKSASDVVLAAFCAAAAERVSGIYRAFSEAEDSAWAEDAMDSVWAEVAGLAEGENCAEALEVLEESGEIDDDDELGSGFYVSQSLALVGIALEAAMRPNFAKADLAANTVETLLGSFDFILSGKRVVTVRYGKPLPPPGPLVSRELRMNDEFFRALNEAGIGLDSPGIPAGVIARLRVLAQGAGAENGEAARRVAEVSGWAILGEQ